MERIAIKAVCSPRNGYKAKGWKMPFPPTCKNMPFSINASTFCSLSIGTAG
jgi:hypothetical protein